MFCFVKYCKNVLTLLLFNYDESLLFKHDRYGKPTINTSVQLGTNGADVFCVSL